QTLFFASGDGKIWQLDSSLHQLYSYNGTPHRMSVSPTGQLLASCALDGSLEVFDVANHRLISHKLGHTGGTTSVSWVDDELWTTGADATIKRWGIREGDLAVLRSIEAPAAPRLFKVASGGWAASVGDGILMISRNGSSIAVN